MSRTTTTTTTTGKSSEKLKKSALRKHCEWFDKDGDGWLSLTDTWLGFLSLGYGYVVSSLAVLIIHATLAYPSQDSWIPRWDRFWMINLNNIHRCKHGSDTGVYNQEGEFDEEKFERMWKRFDKDNKGSLNLTQIFTMIRANRNIYDVVGTVGQVFEWVLLYVLVADKSNGYVVSKENVLAQYDGTLFRKLEKAKRRPL